MKIYIYAVLRAPSDQQFSGGANPLIFTYDNAISFEATPRSLNHLMNGYIKVCGQCCHIDVHSFWRNTLTIEAEGRLPNFDMKTMRTLWRNGWVFHPENARCYNLSEEVIDKVRR